MRFFEYWGAFHTISFGSFFIVWPKIDPEICTLPKATREFPSGLLCLAGTFSFVAKESLQATTDTTTTSRFVVKNLYWFIIQQWILFNCCECHIADGFSACVIMPGQLVRIINAQHYDTVLNFTSRSELRFGSVQVCKYELLGAKCLLRQFTQ